MIKTQIQLPEQLYRDLKRLGKNQEWSLAETLRRGAEILLSIYPTDTLPVGQWTLPAARDCGTFLAPPEDWTELAHADH